MISAALAMIKEKSTKRNLIQILFFRIFMQEIVSYGFCLLCSCNVFMVLLLDHNFNIEH